MDRFKELFIKYKETIMYLIVGGLVTVVNWGCFAILSRVFEDVEPLVKNAWILTWILSGVGIANIISWIISVAFAFVTNKIYVFESLSWEKNLVIKEVTLFVSSRLFTGLFEIIGVPFLVENVGLDGVVFGVKGMGVKIFISIFVIILNYVFSKLLIFKKTDKQEV